MRRETGFVVRAWQKDNRVGESPPGLAAGRRARWFWLSLLLLMALAGAGWGQEVTAEQKARRLLTLAVYTVWPTNAFTTPNSFVVGILGSDACAKVLRSAPDLIHNRKVVVKEFQGPEGTEECQLLLVTEAKAGKLPEVLAHLKNASVLIVLDAGKTGRKEGMINLRIERGVDTKTNKEGELWCFDVNETAAKQAGLTLTSYLKEHARSVF